MSTDRGIMIESKLGVGGGVSDGPRTFSEWATASVGAYRGEDTLPLLRRIEAALTSRDATEVDVVAREMVELPIREHWNGLLTHRRSAALAAALAPFVAGRSVLDVLCGCGDLARALDVFASSVTLVERPTYSARPSDALTFDALDTVRRHEVALLCTVLHHERDPKGLIERIARVADSVVIVENTITYRADAAYNALVDRFFNQVLNPSAYPCPNQHREAADWRDWLLESFNTVEVVKAAAIPGVPLEHEILVGSGRRP